MEREETLSEAYLFNVSLCGVGREYGACVSEGEVYGRVTEVAIGCEVFKRDGDYWDDGVGMSEVAGGAAVLHVCEFGWADV